MLRFFRFVPALMLALGGVASLPARAADLSDSLNRPGRWNANASGKLTVARDEAENALRFEIVFPEGVDRWAYPTFSLKAGEAFAGATRLRFSFKAEQPEAPDAGYAAAYAMFVLPKGAKAPKGDRLKLPTPSPEWRDVDLDLAAYAGELSLATGLRLGMNPRSRRLVFWLRDIRLETPPLAPMGGFAFNDPARWNANAAGELTARFDENENSLRFEVDFPPDVDRWAYPQYTLRPGESLAGAKRLSFSFKAEQPDNPDAGYAAAFFMLALPKDHKAPKGNRIALPAPSAEWRRVELDLEAFADELAHAVGLRIGMNPKSDKLVFHIRDLQLHGVAPPPVVRTALALRGDVPGMVFVAGEAPRFRLAAKDAPKGALVYRVDDFFGREIARGDWPADGEGDADSTLALDAPPPGYYTLRLDAAASVDGPRYVGSRSFVVVPDPDAADAAPRNPDSYFAVDAALSWLGRPQARNPVVPGEAFELITEIIRRTGIASVRERLLWRDVQKDGDAATDWRQYLPNARRLQANGVNVLGMFHDAPPWTRYGKDTTAQTLPPDDLQALYRFTKKLAIEFKGAMGGWEFWNEADHTQHKEPSWDMAAAQKAAYLGFKAGDPALPVLCGSFCQPIGDYAKLFMENGANRYFDIFNYHSYRGLARYPGIVDEIRRLLAAYGNDDMPVYFTETGTNAEGDSGEDAPVPGQRQTTAEQDRLVAEFIVKSPVLLQMLGVARNYFFVLPPYHERDGSKDWGMLRRDYSAKPQLAAFATLSRELGSAVLLGEYPLGDGTRAFLYRQPDGGQSLVYWLTSPLDHDRRDGRMENETVPDAEIDVPAHGNGHGGLTFVELTGRREAVVNGRVKVSRFPAYLHGMRGLEPSIPAAPAGTPGPRKTDEELAVVVRPVFLDGFEIARGRSFMLLQGDTGKLRLEVFNLSEKEQVGRLTLSGLGVDDAEAAEAAGIELRLPPMGKVEWPLTVRSDKALVDMEVGGVFGGRPITPLKVPVRSMAALEAASAVWTTLDLLDPATWRVNASGPLAIDFDENEQALRFSAQSGGGDFWFYPERILNPPEESLAGVVAIRLEYRAPQAARQANLMLVDGTEKEFGQTTMLPLPVPTAEWQSATVFVPPDSEGVAMIRLGANPRGESMDFLVRRVEVLRLPGS